jgi:hypothetical protein
MWAAPGRWTDVAATSGVPNVPNISCPDIDAEVTSTSDDDRSGPSERSQGLGGSAGKSFPSR